MLTLNGNKNSISHCNLFGVNQILLRSTVNPLRQFSLIFFFALQLLQNWPCKICSRYQPHYRLDPMLCSRDAIACSRDKKENWHDSFPALTALPGAQVCSLTCSCDTVCNPTCSRDNVTGTRQVCLFHTATINSCHFITKIMTTNTSDRYKSATNITNYVSYHFFFWAHRSRLIWQPVEARLKKRKPTHSLINLRL